MISFEQVTKIYNKEIIVENLNLDVIDGEVTVILGQSKSGKTTILNMLNRIVVEDLGEIFINDVNINDFDIKTLRLSIGYINKEAGLFSNMDIRKNLSIVPKKLNWDNTKIDNTLDEYFSILDLNYYEYKSKKVYQLNTEEIHKIGLIRAFLNDGDIIIMDEPFKNLQSESRLMLSECLLKLHKELGKTIIFATNNLEEAIKIGDSVAVIEDGKLKSFDRADKLMSNSKVDILNDGSSADLYINILSNMIIEDYMIPKLGKDVRERISQNKTLKDALTFMLQKTVYDLDVLGENGKIVGALNVKDIIKALTYLKG
ncbi:ATP-binding cassette domain-containing protein [Clostridium senegalense]|uniref:ATP-binding cassette domain-containing protein n=1 Tax=Clostridium senegalense TaxID=1465809 RepID=UPI00028A13B9|nr:ATP-binding cassette domain-containing protein [Clostridium senegalense]